MSQHLETLRKYYDVETLRVWIAEYEDTYTTDKGKAQVARWRRVLATLEKVEPSPPITETPKPASQGANFDDYAQVA